MRFDYTAVPDWPPLAWLSVCNREGTTVEVFHGSGVETADEWFCEAVWDGPFQLGDFDRTDVFFGSGARLRDDKLTFVSSMATVDRLHLLKDDRSTFVSNSLPCLLRAAGLRPTCPPGGYIKFFLTIGNGIDSYDDELSLRGVELPRAALSAQDLRLVYVKNIELGRHGVAIRPKPVDTTKFASYDDYTQYLIDRVSKIGDNLKSTHRRVLYEWLGTMSRGFDSPTCVALALPAGLKRAVTFKEARPGVVDDALAIGERLGIETVLHDRMAWQSIYPCEDLFVVADGQGKEISVASLGADLRQTVLLTGHGGGHLWRVNSRTPRSDLRRRGYSGLSMTEFRLHHGFIHMPLPFIGMTREADILRIGNSDEMLPWRSHSDYDQPICARILQEAGVPRALFGQSKAGLSVRFLIGQDGWSVTGKRRLTNWRRVNRRRLGLSSSRLATMRLLQIAVDSIVRMPLRTGRVAEFVRRIRGFLARRLRALGAEDLAFEWAVDSVTRKYDGLPRGNALRRM